MAGRTLLTNGRLLCSARSDANTDNASRMTWLVQSSLANDVFGSRAVYRLPVWPSKPNWQLLPGETMGIIRLLAAPIRTLVRFPLVQLAFVVAIILLLQAADDNSMFGQIFSGLDKLVDATVRLFSELFEVKSFTKSGLTAGLMISYVYLACLLILLFVRVVTRVLVDFIGWSNALGLRNA